MKNPFRGRQPKCEGRNRIHPAGIILITVLYLFITYVLMPILAMMTVS